MSVLEVWSPGFRQLFCNHECNLGPACCIRCCILLAVVLLPQSHLYAQIQGDTAAAHLTPPSFLATLSIGLGAYEDEDAVAYTMQFSTTVSEEICLGVAFTEINTSDDSSPEQYSLYSLESTIGYYLLWSKSYLRLSTGFALTKADHNLYILYPTLYDEATNFHLGIPLRLDYSFGRIQGVGGTASLSGIAVGKNRYIMLGVGISLGQ